MLARQHHQIQNTAPPEPAAMYRDGFLQATRHLGITPDDAAALVESINGRPFDECGWAELERFAVLALFEANESLCAEDPRLGRSAQHTILDVPPLLERRAFRRQVLKRTGDPVIRHWFEGYFDDLDTRLRLEIINPVQTKVHKYSGSRIARQIVGQRLSCSS